MELAEGDQDLDIGVNEAFWENVTESYDDAMGFLDEGDWEIDEKEFAEFMDEQQSVEVLARNHPISMNADDYREKVDEWMKTAEQHLKDRQAELEAQGQDESAGMAPFMASVDIEDAIDVVRWYQAFIYVKLMRALRGNLDSDEFTDQHGFPRDSDGSAKIALIAIDRSIGAWNVLRKLLPDQQQAVVGFLRMLSRLRHDTEAAFPHARAFVRPGFDED
jgi:hypothetical protein